MSAELPIQRLKIGWLVGVVLAFFIFVVIANYSARMARDYPDYDAGRVQTRYQNLDKVNHDETALLMPVDAQGFPTAQWADQDKSLIKIPIDEAMAKEVADLKNKPAAAGAVIPGMAPQAASTNAAAATPPSSGATNAATASAPSAGSTNAATAKPPAAAKTGKSAKGKNTPPLPPDLQKKPASPAAPTVKPTAVTAPAGVKESQ